MKDMLVNTSSECGDVQASIVCWSALTRSDTIDCGGARHVVFALEAADVMLHRAKFTSNGQVASLFAGGVRDSLGALLDGSTVDC